MPLYEWLFAPPGSQPAAWDERAARRVRRSTPRRSSSPTTRRRLLGRRGEPRRATLVGFCTGYQDLHSVRFGYRAWVEDLAVDPERRSQGVGEALLDAAKRLGARARRHPPRARLGRGAHRRPPLLRARGRRLPLDLLRLGALSARPSGSRGMAGRIVLFGATGYTGRLTADAMVARGDRPVLAGAQRRPARGDGRRARRARDRGRRRRRPRLGPGAGRAGRRDRRHGRPVRALGRPGGRGGDRRRRRATSTRPASRRSSGGCSSTSAREPSRRAPAW